MPWKIFQRLGEAWGHDQGPSRVVAPPLLVVAIVLLAGTAARAGGRAVEGVLNLNTAPVELLTLLPGIGPAKARAILSYRARRPFRTVDELVRVKGIGRRMVRQMRPHLATAGPSTARGTTEAAVADPPPPARSPVPGPPTPRAVCRPAAVVVPRFAQPHGRDGGRWSSVRSPANHCTSAS